MADTLTSSAGLDSSTVDASNARYSRSNAPEPDEALRRAQNFRGDLEHLVQNVTGKFLSMYVSQGNSFQSTPELTDLPNRDNVLAEHLAQSVATHLAASLNKYATNPVKENIPSAERILAEFTAVKELIVEIPGTDGSASQKVRIQLPKVSPEDRGSKRTIRGIIESSIETVEATT